MSCVDFYFPSLYTGAVWDLDGDWQRELYAIDVDENPVESDDHGIGGVEMAKEDKKGSCDGDTCMSLQNLLTRWHEREQKLQAFQKSLDDISVWTSIGTAVQRDAILGARSHTATKELMDCEQVLQRDCPVSHESIDYETETYDAILHPSMDIHEQVQLVKSEDLIKEFPLVNGENCASPVLPTSEHVVEELYRERAEVLHGYRLAGMERARQRELKQQTEGEAACKNLARVAQKKKTLKIEQANKLAELERERMLESRLFEEEQKQAQELLQAQDNAVELKCRALQEMMMSIKAREEEMAKSRLEYQAAQDRTFFNEARRYLAGRKILRALKQRRSRLQRSCTRIQAEARLYLSRKKQKELQQQKVEATENCLPLPAQQQGVEYPSPVPMDELMTTGEVVKSTTNEGLALQTATGNVQSKLLKLQQLFRKAMKVGVKACPSYEPSKAAPAVTSVAKPEVAVGDNYEFEYEDDIIVRSERERLIIWLKQIADGWEVARSEALKTMQEARSIGLLSLVTVVESIITDREKKVIANLQSSAARGSGRAFRYWLTKARMYGLKEIVPKCCESYEERLDKAKQSLRNLAQKGSKHEYMAAFNVAHSLGLSCEVEEAVKIVLDRTSDMVRRTRRQVKRVCDRGQLSNVVVSNEETACSLGIASNISRYIKRFASEASVSDLARGNVAVGTDVNLNISKAAENGGPLKISKSGMRDVEESYWHLDHWLTNVRLVQIIESKTEVDPWVMHEEFCIWSFNWNWPEVDKLRGAWQEQVLGARAVLRPELENSAIQTLDCRKVFPKYEDVVQGSNNQRQQLECVARARKNTSDSRLQRAGNTKSEALEENLVMDLDDESEDDERRGLEPILHLPVSFLVRTDDNFEWERTLCMPLVLTKAILEKKASCSGADLRRLKKLDMTYDGLSSIAEGSLAQWCPSLECLVLDRNKLTTLSGLKGCEGHLEHISAKDNFISDLTGLDGLARLTTLHLEGNSLRQLVSTVSMLPEKTDQRAGAATHQDQPAISEHELQLRRTYNDAFGFSHLTTDTRVSSGRNTPLPVFSAHGNSCQRFTSETNSTLVRRGQVRTNHDGGYLRHGSWPRLKELGLSCNKLAKIVALGSICPHLEVLDLSSNQLVTLGVVEGDALAGLACLRVLDVGQNKLKGRSLWDSLKNCPLLVSLVASRNRLSELPTHPGNVFLREIWLNGNAIRRLSCSAWLPNLRRLYLQDNSISCLEPLWGCPALEVLDLSFNSISDICQLRQLACFPCLRTLQMNDNPVSEETDYVHKILEAVPWLVELDNEPISEQSKDRAVRTIFLKIRDCVGPGYLKENLEKLLACGAAARCQGSLSLNALLNGMADRETLWAVACNIMLSAQTSSFLRTRLGIYGDALQHDAQGHLSADIVEARWNVLSFQEMGYVHRQRLQTSYRERTLDDCKVGELGVDMLAIPHTRIFPNDSIVFSVDHVADTEISRQSRGKHDPEQYLAEHINFHPGAYQEIMKIGTEYSSLMDTQRRRIVQLQALARRFLSRHRFKQLREEKEYAEFMRTEQLKQEAWKKENSISKIQSFWRGRKVRQQGILLSLREEALRSLVLENYATTIQAAWRGCRIRSKLKQALARCKYVDTDEYDYVSVNEEFEMKDSFLEENVRTGVDDVTYPGVEFVLGKKKPTTVARDVRFSARSSDTRHEKRWVTGPRSSSVPGNNNSWLSATPPLSACAISSGDVSPRPCRSRVATAPVRHIGNKTKDYSLIRSNSQSQRRSNQEGTSEPNSPAPKSIKSRPSTRHKHIKDIACGSNQDASNNNVKAVCKKDQISSGWSDDHPYLRRTDEKKKAAVAEIVKDWGFKDEKTAQSFLKAREKAKGNGKAQNEAYRAFLKDPQERLNVFRAKTEVRASQVPGAATLRPKRNGSSDGLGGLQTTSSPSELQKVHRGCCSASSGAATPVVDRSQCSSKSSTRGVPLKPGTLLEPRSVTASSTTLDLRPTPITPESFPIHQPVVKRRRRKASFVK